MKSMIRPRYLVLGIALAALLPWGAVWLSARPERIEWQCLADIEFATHSGKRLVRSWGRADAEYRANGTGFTSFSGFLRASPDTGKPDDAPLTRVHRAMEFDYRSVGSILRVSTTHTTRLINDASDDEMVYRYLLPGFRPGNTDYFQAMRVGEGMAVAVADQPRVYCARP
ncbi:hypothetical protein [Pandoraea sp. PE-S2T-3]|uniref:hypothetical protein n=1 Tax=Pandoraea sp. PE-S2T-3 TaxID=1986993 RepID=UPI000B3F86C3|nr:hypothetical protein [Pandoraea sp. PE-S2T-3]